MFDALMALPREQIYLTDDHMNGLGISVKKLELDPEANPTSKDKPEIFTPFSRSKLHGIYKLHKPAFDLPAYEDPDYTNVPGLDIMLAMDNHLGEEIPEELRSSEELFSLDEYSIWDCSITPRTMTGLCQARVDRGYEWRINNSNFTSDKGYPHGVIVSAQNRVPDEEHEFSAIRGELVVINKMMMSSMKPPNSNHEIYPLLLITCHCRKVRIIEAHFDGDFHLKCSPLIDCASFNQETFELLTRWYMSEPCGNTRGPTQPIHHPFAEKRKSKTKTTRPETRSISGRKSNLSHVTGITA